MLLLRLYLNVFGNDLPNSTAVIGYSDGSGCEMLPFQIRLVRTEIRVQNGSFEIMNINLTDGLVNWK